MIESFNIKKFHYLGALLITFLMACNAEKQIQITPPLSGPSTVVYTADLTGVFPNPERGWHNRRSIVRDRNFSDIKSAGNTLIHSYLRLDSYKDTDVIPQLYLDSLQQGLNAVRTAGLKIVLRATHVWDESPTVLESRILKHIEQVNAVISANADVVNHL